MDIEIQTKLFKLRNTLNTISDASFAFKTLYNKYPLNSLNNEIAKKLILAYEAIIETVTNSIQNTEDGKHTTT